MLDCGRRERWRIVCVKKDGETTSLAEILSIILRKYVKLLNAPPYNYIIHTAPALNVGIEHYHWHIEIIPRLTKMAGFEWGTGFYINPTPPEEATAYLKETQI